MKWFVLALMSGFFGMIYATELRFIDMFWQIFMMFIFACLCTNEKTPSKRKKGKK